MLNYLARLGWSHGDEELFSREQMVQWFDGPPGEEPGAVGPGQARLGQCALHEAGRRHGWPTWRRSNWPGATWSSSRRRRWLPACALYKDRCSTVVELADWIELMFVDVQPRPRTWPRTSPMRAPGAAALRERFTTIDWDKATIAQAMKDTLATTS
jgi:glutamyl-tRNA synthetase